MTFLTLSYQCNCFNSCNTVATRFSPPLKELIKSEELTDDLRQFPKSHANMLKHSYVNCYFHIKYYSLQTLDTVPHKISHIAMTTTFIIDRDQDTSVILIMLLFKCKCKISLCSGWYIFEIILKISARAEVGRSYHGYGSPTNKEALRKWHGNYSSVCPKRYILLFIHTKLCWRIVYIWGI